MLDEYIWGKVSRISPEAPVPVVDVARESYFPGGAANVARNVREFTPHTMALGRAGADRYGCQLRELLAACGIDTSGVQQDDSAITTVKTRIIARNQQVVRVDRESRTPLDPAARRSRPPFLRERRRRTSTPSSSPITERDFSTSGSPTASARSPAAPAVS